MTEFKTAFRLSLPVLGAYWFLGIVGIKHGIWHFFAGGTIFYMILIQNI